VIFGDTSAWFAALVSGDPNHRVAAPLLASTPISQLVTSDYVLVELLNLLKMRRESKRAFEFGRQILEGTSVVLFGSIRLMFIKPGLTSRPTATKAGASPIALAGPSWNGSTLAKHSRSTSIFANLGTSR
jgi:hypothetical protein